MVVSDDAGTSRLTEATHLSWGNNYGEMNPTITLADFDHPVLAGLRGVSFNLVSVVGDVDEVQIHDPDVQALGLTETRRLPVLLTHDSGQSREVIVVWEVARTDDDATMHTLINNAVNWAAGNGPSPSAPALDAVHVEAMSADDDGDTVDFSPSILGKSTVRYTGIDTPELQNAQVPENECFAVQAKQRNAQLVSNRDVWFEIDKRTIGGQQRLLAYVRTAPTLALDAMVNYILVLEGYAKIFKVGKNWLYVDDFRSAQIEAVRLRRGMWSDVGNCDPYASANIVIAAVQYWGRDGDEFVVIMNRGSTDVNLAGWTLENDSGRTFEFPGTYDLEAWSPISGTSLSICTVHSGPGQNQKIGGDLNWVSAERWPDKAGTAYLKNASGEIVHTYNYRGF